MEKKYIAIFDNTVRMKFLKLIDENGFKELSYYGYSEYNISNNTDIFIMSDLEWQKTYIKKQYYNVDELNKLGTKIKEGIIIFDWLGIKDANNILLMKERKKFNIHNGCIFILQINDIIHQLTIATNDEDFDIVKFINQNHNKVINFIKILSENKIINYPEQINV